MFSKALKLFRSIFSSSKQKRGKQNRKPPFTSLDNTAIVQAIVCCTKNAIAYLKDAEILFDQGSFNRACALAILGIEEVAKTEIVAANTCLKKGSPVDLCNLWKNFVNHRHKQKRLIDALLFAIHQTGGDSAIVSLKGKNIDATYLEKIKQRCLYVDYYTDTKNFEIRRVTKEESENLIKILRQGIEIYKDYADTDYCNQMIGKVRNASPDSRRRFLHDFRSARSEYAKARRG